MDFAFIERVNPILNHRYLPTQTPNGKFPGYTNTSMTYVVGQTILKHGMTTGETSGNITSNSVSNNVGGVSLTDFVEATYRAIGGDSGAIVFTASPLPALPNQSNFFGIQSHSTLSNGQWVSGSRAYFCKRTNFPSNINIELYQN